MAAAENRFLWRCDFKVMFVASVLCNWFWVFTSLMPKDCKRALKEYGNNTNSIQTSTTVLEYLRATPTIKQRFAKLKKDLGYGVANNGQSETERLEYEYVEVAKHGWFTSYRSYEFGCSLFHASTNTQARRRQNLLGPPRSPDDGGGGLHAQAHGQQQNHC